MARKPKGSYRAYKEQAPSVKLFNYNKIFTELYMQKSMAKLQ